MSKSRSSEETSEPQATALASPLQELESLPNWPGYEHPLACRTIKKGDQQILYPVMKRSAKKLKGFISWAKYSPSWDFKTVTKFVNDHLDDELPRFHLIFSIGKQVVGFGSLAPVSTSSRDVQVALWVALGWEGRGIGSWITTVLEWYGFYVFGYDNVYYQHDSANRASGKLPQKLGYTFSHTFEDDRHAQEESGFWYSWRKERPTGLAPGFIDTGDWGNWPTIQFPWKSLV